MLVGAILIVVNAPRCKPEPQPQWYQDTVVYELNAKEFAGGLKGKMFCNNFVCKLYNTCTIAHHNLRCNFQHLFENFLAKRHKKNVTQ